jgi:hypothetical protein
MILKQYGEWIWEGFNQLSMQFSDCCFEYDNTPSPTMKGGEFID